MSNLKQKSECEAKIMGNKKDKRKYFLLRGLTKGIEGGQEPYKTLLHLFNQQKNKIFKSTNR